MKQRFTSAVVMILVVSITFGGGYVLGTHNGNDQAAAQNPDLDAQFQPVFQAWNLLHDNYVDPLDDEVLINGILTGLMAGAGDENTDYMDPERYERARVPLQGNYEGIGATVSQNPDTGELRIIEPFPGSPAATAGILPGDVVIAVDGEDITDLDEAIIINMVKGPAGTDVILTIRRGESEILDITVTRDQIVIPSVDFEILDNNIGFVALRTFGRNTDAELRDALVQMDVENLDGLIIDVRSNTGGYLDTLLEIMSMFVEGGTIFVEQDGSGENSIQAYGNPIAPTVPMVVLVDEFSASASEVLMGTLQDYDRATVIGTQTFGKGSVQRWYDLANGGGIRVTISRWFTPDGRSVEPDGLLPDIELEYVPFEGELTDLLQDNQIQFAVDFLLEEAGEAMGPLAGSAETAPIN